MNSSDSFKRKMFQLVLNLLTLFSGIWSGIASVASVVTSFTNTLQEIDEKAAEQQITISTFTANKKKRKREMAEKSLIVRGKLSAHAAATGDTILLKKVKIAFYKLFYLKDTTAIANAQIILDAANDLTPAERTAADISAGDMTALSDSIQTYKEAPSPEQMRAVRKQFSSEGHDLENVDVLLTSDENTFEEMTDEQGIVKQQISPDIKYKAKFILPDYEVQELEDIRLNAGQHQTLKVTMIKK
jgi:2C-methyl-D-erythritol 2,4-cyclodiphosphate synthase